MLIAIAIATAAELCLVPDAAYSGAEPYAYRWVFDATPLGCGPTFDVSVNGAPAPFVVLGGACAATELWVAVPSLVAGEPVRITVEAGGTAGDGDAVFPAFFDDFDSFDAATWSVSGPPPAAAAGSLTLAGGSALTTTVYRYPGDGGWTAGARVEAYGRRDADFDVGFFTANAPNQWQGARDQDGVSWTFWDDLYYVPGASCSAAYDIIFTDTLMHGDDWQWLEFGADLADAWLTVDGVAYDHSGITCGLAGPRPLVFSSFSQLLSPRLDAVYVRPRVDPAPGVRVWPAGDTDADGREDAAEGCYDTDRDGVLDPDDDDDDGDGLLSADEAGCGGDPRLADTDGDGLGDAEAAAAGTRCDDPLDPAPRDTGSNDTGRDDTGRDDTGTKHTGRGDTGSKHTGRGDTGSKHTGRGDTGSEHTGRATRAQPADAVSGCRCASVGGGGAAGGWAVAAAAWVRRRRRTA